MAWLAAQGAPRLALFGHSFGGAVVIRAGAASPAVVAVTAPLSQSLGTQGVAALAPRSLFLLHGTDDEVLPVRCSEDIFRRAREPKVLLRLACRHGLDECRDTVDRELGAWLRAHLLHRDPHAAGPWTGPDDLQGPCVDARTPRTTLRRSTREHGGVAVEATDPPCYVHPIGHSYAEPGLGASGGG